MPYSNGLNISTEKLWRYEYLECIPREGFPRQWTDKDSACNAGDAGVIDWIPGSGRSPGETAKRSIGRDIFRSTINKMEYINRKTVYVTQEKKWK